MKYRAHPQANEIKRLRKLLPELTKDLQDENVAFMASRLEGVPDEELDVAWKKEYDLHLHEMASFLYDMYVESLKSHRTKN